MRDGQDIREAMALHADTVMRACTLYLREQADRDDAFQETFLRYAQSTTVFNGEEHRKAWLIRVASNICKDMLRRMMGAAGAIDDVDEGRLSRQQNDEAKQHTDIIEALRTLDEKYRAPLYLKYYEGYTAAEIGEMLGMPEGTVYTNLARGRARLEEVLTRG